MKLFRFLFFVFPVFALGQQLLRHLTTTEKVQEITITLPPRQGGVEIMAKHRRHFLKTIKFTLKLIYAIAIGLGHIE